jgi:hypothetical protein
MSSSSASSRVAGELLYPTGGAFDRGGDRLGATPLAEMSPLTRTGVQCNEASSPGKRTARLRRRIDQRPQAKY